MHTKNLIDQIRWGEIPITKLRIQTGKVKYNRLFKNQTTPSRKLQIEYTSKEILNCEVNNIP